MMFFHQIALSEQFEDDILDKNVGLQVSLVDKSINLTLDVLIDVALTVETQ